MTTHTHADPTLVVPEPDDEERGWTEGQAKALLEGQEVAARASTWWSETAATLAEIRKNIQLPHTPDSAAEWFDNQRIDLHVDPDMVRGYLDALVASFDSVAADYRREATRLGHERESVARITP